MEEQVISLYPVNKENTLVNETDGKVESDEVNGVGRFDTLKSWSDCILSHLIYFITELFDFFLYACKNEWVRNVVAVFLTVLLEVFVVIVLAASTVLTTVIVNADDAYKTCNNSINQNKRNLQDAPVREQGDIEDASRLDGLPSEDVSINNFAMKLTKK
ncbi:hypothetical protein FQA39_LY09337 [Lamprigera yunnana]|nr:hypothetical protein FQA39_LY09337 [Lamprigera yunnana]